MPLQTRSKPTDTSVPNTSKNAEFALRKVTLTSN